jgi:RHS repeat-associated protein
MHDPTTSGVTEGFGLMFYGARFYDPQLGRFTQADTIIPGGVQGLDRYAAMNNNPVRYNDPSGHNADCGIGEEGCKAGQYTPQNITLPAKPSVRGACGFGAGTACSNRDVNFLPNENTKIQYGYRYPLQTVFELLEEQGFPVVPPSDVQYDESNPQKLIVGETLLTEIQNNPTQKYILIGHSAGAVPVIYAANQAPDQVAALILLDPDYTYQTQNGIENINVNLSQEKVYIGHSSQGINNSSDHYFGLSGPYAHTQLSTDTNVATSIYNFIMNAITGR